MVLPDFALSRVSTVDEAVERLAQGGIPYAGGTELVAAMLIGIVAPGELVDLKRIDALVQIASRSDEVSIGAAARHVEVTDYPDIRRRWPILAQACSSLGNQRVRSTGTIGGNLCFADPRSDVSTVLFALGAEVSLASGAGIRRIPISEFVHGAMYTDLSTDELMTSIHVPDIGPAQAYVRHQPAEYPSVCVAVASAALDGRPFIRVALGAVGERPQLLVGASRADLNVREFVAGVDITEDLNGSDDYKRHLATVFIERALDKLERSRP